MSSLPKLALASLPPAVVDLCAQLRGAGYGSWIVGGCVRDLLMEKAVSDWDVATSATPDQVRRVFRRTIPTGIAHGTVTVLHRGGSFEVTTLRGEGAYSDGRRPDSVHFVTGIDEDLARRDFTVNAIALDPEQGELVDPWGGLGDLAKRVVRAVRDPSERFGEDGLRVLRAARFVGTLEFDLDPVTRAAIPGSLDSFRKVSPERVRDEWMKLLSKAREPSRAFRIMRETGMLAVHGSRLAEQDDGAFDVAMWRLDTPRLREVSSMPPAIARVIALVLDLDREIEGWLRSLRFSNEEREIVLHALRVLRDGDARRLDGVGTDAAAQRRFLQLATRARFADLLLVDEADREARGEPARTPELDTLRAEIAWEAASDHPLTVGELSIKGADVMSALGSGPGRHVGRILAELLERTLVDPSLNTRDALLALVPDVARALDAPQGTAR